MTDLFHPDLNRLARFQYEAQVLVSLDRERGVEMQRPGDNLTSALCKTVQLEKVRSRYSTERSPIGR